MMSIQQDAYAAYRELTLRGMILGALITVVLTASNVYLGLKVGLTFASSIPAAVISMAVLRMFKGSNILENNMVQTQASSAGTLTAIIFILPALLMMGYWSDFPLWQTTLICITGGILGVIFSIPLRHVMVVESPLPYPEGVAAAEILKVGQTSRVRAEEGQETAIEYDSGAKEILKGGILAAAFSFMAGGLKVISDSAGYWFKAGGAVFHLPMGFSFALLGAGYLVGIAGGIAILVGLALTWLILVPYFSVGDAAIVSANTINSLQEIGMTVWKEKVRLIGVGVMGIAAIWTLLSLFRPMVEGMYHSLQLLKKDNNQKAIHRTDLDLSPKTMLYITAVVIVLIAAVFYYFVNQASVSISPVLLWSLVIVATLAAVIIGFMVAAACGYMAGLVGSSASPISGIGIISILCLSVLLLLIGELCGLTQQKGGIQFLTALAILTTSVVVAIACIANDNLQDLKTGLLVHATPWKQQVALIIGVIVGSFVISPVLELLYHAYGFAGSLPRANMDINQALSAPQATIMMIISNGIFDASLNWDYIFFGVGLGVFFILVDLYLRNKTVKYSLPVLAVGMGIYLPPTINTPLFVGALLSFLLNIRLRKYDEEAKKDSVRKGTLFASGLIVGESLIGVLMAIAIVVTITISGEAEPFYTVNFAAMGIDWGITGQLLGVLAFVLCIILFARVVLKRKAQ